jgi:starch synthase
MRILTLCAEYAPLAKVGGLADVSAGLAGWLARRGHHVVVVLPYYGLMRERGVRVEPHAAVGPLPVGQGQGEGEGDGHYTVHRIAGGEPGGPEVYAVDAPAVFGREVYAAGADEAARFLLLSRAALEFARASGFAPHVVHCHDWHASPAALMLRDPAVRQAGFRGTWTVLTIHNIGYQGAFDVDALGPRLDGTLRGLFAPEDLARGQVNFLRAGIAQADALTTVSPTHAREIQTPEHGHGLDALLRQRRHRLAGILNGVDYGAWSPERDPLLPAHYSAADLAGKRVTRRGLVAELGLDAPDGTPVVGLVSRLAAQKGIDLVVEALPALLRERAFACAFLGSGDARYSEALRGLAAAFPGRVVHVDAQDEGLAHRVIAGSDLFLVPSRYEPCGLTQMYAMRYGTVPVVRLTGGLADTVTHYDPATGQGTGSVFRDADAGGLAWGLGTALDWFGDPRAWDRLVQNGMAQDFSWDRQGPRYEQLFSRLVDGV